MTKVYTTEEKEQRTLELLDYVHDHDPATWVRLITLRTMLEHREISTKDLADALGVSKYHIQQTLSGETFRPPENEWPENLAGQPKYAAYESPHAYYLSKLDAIEHAITEITDADGGVYRRCGCTPQGVDAVISELTSGAMDLRSFTQWLKEGA